MNLRPAAFHLAVISMGQFENFLHFAIFFEDEMTLATQSTVQRTWARVGQTPQCRTFGRYKGIKAFGAISGQGGFRYRVQLDYFSQETFRAFLMAFRASTEGYLIFILDGAPYHKGEAITDFVEAARSGFRSLQRSSALQGIYAECQQYFA